MRTSVGTTFKLDGVDYKSVPSTASDGGPCTGCAFRGNADKCFAAPQCTAPFISEHVNVVFVRDDADQQE